MSSSFSCSTSWDPSSKIVFVAGTYYIDLGFVNQLVDDYAPLYLCDDATVIWNEEDGFEVHDADSGELLYELGFRTGDLITEVNGQPLTDYGSLWTILFAQWFQLGETSYEVELVRSASPVVLEFEIVATI